jgi:hypothetical protein
MRSVSRACTSDFNGSVRMFCGNLVSASVVGALNKFCWSAGVCFIVVSPLGRRPSVGRPASRVQQASKVAQRPEINTRRLAHRHCRSPTVRHPDRNLERRSVRPGDDEINLVTKPVPPNHRGAFARVGVVRIVNGDFSALVVGSIPLL